MESGVRLQFEPTVVWIFGQGFMNLCVLGLIRFGDRFPTFIVDFLTRLIASDTIDSLYISSSCLDILLNENKQITDTLNFYGLDNWTKINAYYYIDMGQKHQHSLPWLDHQWFGSFWNFS